MKNVMYYNYRELLLYISIVLHYYNELFCPCIITNRNSINMIYYTPYRQVKYILCTNRCAHFHGNKIRQLLIYDFLKLNCISYKDLAYDMIIQF